MAIRKCNECGRTFDSSMGSFMDGPKDYCSERCRRSGIAVKKAEYAEISANFGRFLKLAGVVLLLLGTLLFYKFPKFLKEKNKKFLYAYIIFWAVLIAFSLIYFLIIRPKTG